MENVKVAVEPRGSLNAHLKDQLPGHPEITQMNKDKLSDVGIATMEVSGTIREPVPPNLADRKER